MVLSIPTSLPFLFAFLPAAFAGKPSTLRATYHYEELMPNYISELKLTFALPCPAGKQPALLSDEWAKDVEVVHIRKGKKTKIRDRSFLVRGECAASKPSELKSASPLPTGEPRKLIFRYENSTQQVQHIHVTLLDGLEVTDAETTKNLAAAARKSP
jgi:hypothetical protein